MSKTTLKPDNSPPPRWLNRAEKLIFKQVIEERKVAGLPISATVAGSIADFAMCRTRVRDLKRTLAVAQSEISELDGDRAYVLALCREIDRASRLAMVLSDRISK
ncbi:MAG: hypothetical protein KF694_01815 [Mesorhizobium sp.]|nr:hypothetical protein [Mesorhizobium sp.]